MVSRILSLAVAAAYLIGAYGDGGFKGCYMFTAFLVLPLACIWFSEAMGDYVGCCGTGRTPITKSSPGCFVALGGWLLLLVPALVWTLWRWYG